MKSKFDLSNLASRLRIDWKEDLNSPIDITALAMQQEEITLITMKMPQDMSGMCAKTEGEVIIAVNSEMSVGRQRFTLAHELYHAYFDESMKTFVCGKDMGSERTDSEKEADLFASYLLVPPAALDEVEKGLKEDSWTLKEVVKTEQKFGISHLAMLVRLKSESRINQRQFDMFSNIQVTKAAAEYGFPKDLYCNTATVKPYSCAGSYLRMIEEAFSQELIGSGKRNELLMDGFADIDTVYGEYIND